MVAATRRLLAKDGAQFHARIKPSGYNQVSLETRVRLGDQAEPEQRSRCTNEATARTIADQLAKEAGFSTVMWES